MVPAFDYVGRQVMGVECRSFAGLYVMGKAIRPIWAVS